MAKVNETDHSVASATGKGKRKWLRRFILVLCLLLFGLILLVVLIPTIISTGAGKRFVMNAVSDQIAGDVDADSLNVSWGAGQSLSGVVVRDVDGSEVVRVGKVDLPDVSLLAVLRSGMSLGELRIEQVTGNIVGQEDGTTNLQRALAPTSGKSSTEWPEGLSFAVILQDFDVSYYAPSDNEPIRLVIPKAELSANDPTQFVLKLNAEVSRGQNTGSINVDAKVDQLFGADGMYQPTQATASVDGDLTDLPTDLIDTLMQEGGRLTILLGSVLNGKVLADVTTTGGNASIKADSEHLHVNAKVAFDDAGLRQDGESAIRFTLVPEAWALISAVDGHSASTLAEPVDVAIELHRLVMPFTEAGLDTGNIDSSLGLVIGDTRMKIDGVGEVTLKSTTGSVQTSQLGKSLTAQFKTTSGLNNKPGGVAIDIELADLMHDANRIDPAHVSAKVNGRLTNAPVAAILDELLPGITKGLATRSLGTAMDATVNFNTAPRSDGGGMAGGFEIDVLTEGADTGLNTTLIGDFSYNEQTVKARLADGSYVRMTLVQELIDDYRDAFGSEDAAEATGDMPALTLGAPADVRVDLAKAVIVLNALEGGGYQLDPDALDLACQLTSPQVSVLQGGKDAATLKGLLIGIVNTGLSGDTKLALDAQIDYPTKPGEEANPGSIKSVSTITGLAKDNGKLSFTKASYKADTVIRQAPIDLVDALFGMDGELIAAVGPRALLTMDGEYTPNEEGAAGGFDLLLKSRTSSADLKLLIADGRWTLKNDAPLSFRVTPGLSQTLLKQVNPFLGGAVSAKLPIGVTVKQEGFSAPLSGVTLKNLNANLTLDLGELDLRGEGQLKHVLNALGVGDRSLLNVSFTPVAISLLNGKLSYRDLVMAFDEIKLGFSGEVDLNSRVLDLRMTIPGTSLSRITWLEGKYDPNHVIVIPLTGTFDEPKLDVKLLTGEIAKAALRGQLGDVAGQKIRDKLGNEAGGVVGGLLNEVLKTGRLPEPVDGAGESETEPEAESESKVDAPLTKEELEARKERRRLRRERLEREQAEQEAKQNQ